MKYCKLMNTLACRGRKLICKFWYYINLLLGSVRRNLLRWFLINYINTKINQKHEKLHSFMYHSVHHIFCCHNLVIHFISNWKWWFDNIIISVRLSKLLSTKYWIKAAFSRMNIIINSLYLFSDFNLCLVCVLRNMILTLIKIFYLIASCELPHEG